MDRDCKNCIYARTPDDPFNNGCTAWSCEFIDRREAIKLIKSIVRCKDCKHSKNCVYPAKWNWCPDGERRTDE